MKLEKIKKKVTDYLVWTTFVIFLIFVIKSLLVSLFR